MSPSTPSERALRSRLAAHTKWANTDDPASATAPARQAFLDRFEREVDPEAELSQPERARRAEHARKAYFTNLALKSAQSRRKAREARQQADALEQTATAAESEMDGGGAT